MEHSSSVFTHTICCTQKIQGTPDGEGKFDLGSLSNSIGWSGPGLFQQLWDKVHPPSGVWESFALFLGVKNPTVGAHFVPAAPEKNWELNRI